MNVKWQIRKYSQIYAQKVCLSRPVIQVYGGYSDLTGLTDICKLIRVLTGAQLLLKTLSCTCLNQLIINIGLITRKPDLLHVNNVNPPQAIFRS